MRLFLLDHFFLQLMAADQEATDGKQTGDTGDGGNRGAGDIFFFRYRSNYF